MPILFGVRAEVTADNTSIRVSWQWSCQGVLDLVRVHYQPEGSSLMMYTVDSITATSATLPNLQCNTNYTIWVMLEVVRLIEQVPPEWFLYQQEVLYNMYITFYTSLVLRPCQSFRRF